jgi:peptidoglycan/LPS O-acetylase OafA/YrhL
MQKTGQPVVLHAVNAIRVIAEYFVVRMHALPDHRKPGDYNEHEHGPLGMDIMSLFYVMSGFVMMYKYGQDDFQAWHAKLAFIKKRPAKIYPILILIWLFCLPGKILNPSEQEKTCWIYYMCPAIQLVMLDSWFGCGWRYIFIGPSWFISSVFWLWMAFPFAKDYIALYLFGHRFVWTMMSAIYLAWVLLFYLLWDYDMYTLAPMPILRAGEFLIGCGAALALKSEKVPMLVDRKYFWIPAATAILLFNLQTAYHSLGFICLHQDASHDDCSIWRARKEWVEVHPPCMTIFDKILNKYALAFACLLYGVAKAELSDDSGWAIRILHADLFKFLSSYSLTLYLAHFSMVVSIRWVGLKLLGWPRHRWHDDTLLFLTYLACYGLHHALMRLVAVLERKQAGSLEDPDDEPLIQCLQTLEVEHAPVVKSACAT